MAKTDKVIAAFLVSMGLFTVQYAADYVGTLSQKDKTSFLNLAKSDNKQILLCDRSPEVPSTQLGETTKSS